MFNPVRPAAAFDSNRQGDRTGHWFRFKSWCGVSGGWIILVHNGN
jgi:hypothetical protein